MSAIVKCQFRAHIWHKIQASAQGLFLTLRFVLKVQLPDFLYLFSPAVALDCRHKRSFLTSNSLFLCASKTGTRIRPPPLPLYVHSPCFVFSSRLKLGIMSKNQGFTLIIRGMTVEGRIVFTLNVNLQQSPWGSSYLFVHLFHWMNI